MLVLLVGGLLWSPWSFGFLLLLVLIGGMAEFYALAAQCGARPLRIVGIASGVGLWLCCFDTFARSAGFADAAFSTLGTCGLLFLLLALPACFICQLFRPGGNPFADIGATLGGVLYVALPMAMLPFVSLFAAGGWQPWTVICFVFIIWANDVFAYLVGMTVGRHKLCERISPRKTVEGFFGGLAGAIAAGAAAALCLDMSIGMWCGVALVAAATGVLGDLVESMFKRAAGVKDSGSVIPGHGGVLDRFDALLMATPFVCTFLLMMSLFVL